MATLRLLRQWLKQFAGHRLGHSRVLLGFLRGGVVAWIAVVRAMFYGAVIVASALAACKGC